MPHQKGPSPETRKRARKIRFLLRRGLTQEEIGARLRLHQCSVSRIVRQFRLVEDRAGEKPSWFCTVPPIDPEKAARITAAKRAYWSAA